MIPHALTMSDKFPAEHRACIGGERMPVLARQASHTVSSNHDYG